MSTKPTIWIDFENAPHVWVLSPIIHYLRHEGYALVLTARDFSCTVGLCRRLGHDVRVVGLPGSGRTTATKAMRLLDRALGLFRAMWSVRGSIALAISHGSRSQILAAHYLGIRTLSLDDYEFSDQSLVRFVDHMLVPFPIPQAVWGRHADRVDHYPGLKEELYLCDFRPEKEGLEELRGLDYVKVLFRPEGRLAHYRSTCGRSLQDAVVHYVGSSKSVFLVVLPRDAEQARALGQLCQELHVPHWLPCRTLDGPSLVWEMDLVLGGGGTMTREAAVLGIPSYSFFSGRWGAVDRYLQRQSRLVELATEGDMRRILLQRRDSAPVRVSRRALDFVTSFIQDAIG